MRKITIISFTVMVISSIALHCTVRAKEKSDANHTTESVVESESYHLANDSVNLYDVKPVTFGERIGDLVCNGETTTIYWGVDPDDVSPVMSKDSGYPGFDEPLIIAGNLDSLNFLDSLKSDNSYLWLYTDYGIYKYRVKNLYVANKGMDEHSYFDVQTQESIIDLNSGKEILYVVCQQQGSFFIVESEKVDGTQIIIE